MTDCYTLCLAVCDVGLLFVVHFSFSCQSLIFSLTSDFLEDEHFKYNQTDFRVSSMLNVL